MAAGMEFVDSTKDYTLESVILVKKSVRAMMMVSHE